MDFLQCMSLDKARNLVLDSIGGIAAVSETVFLTDALGRVTAESIIARETLPAFSRSTVDGFAVRSADTFGASEAVPSLFAVIGEVAMGEPTAIKLSPGTAAVIPTGGMLPENADAVMMLEYTDQPDPHTLLALKAVVPGENVILKGEDIDSDAVIVMQGQTIAPRHIGLLAACGCAHVPVRKPLQVAVISTGNELVDIQDPLAFGQIRDINSYALEAALTEAGCVVQRMGIIKDRYDLFFDTLARATASYQMVIISGGSSVGARDYTVQAMGELGAPGVLIHGIAIRPGKPAIFGMFGKVPIFGLPGHPVAAMTVCDQLVKPAVRKLLGQKRQRDFLGISACLDRNIASAPGRDDFINVRISRQENQYIASPLLGKSGLISIMAQADGVVHIPAAKSGLDAGEMVEVLLNQSEQ